MRAAIIKKFGGPDCINVLSDVSIPTILEGYQVLIRMVAAGVNPVDTYIRSGQYGALPPLPYVTGKDGSGVVEKIGDSVANVKIGDRVWCTFATSGTSAEFAVAQHVYRLPDDVLFSEGACIGVPYMTAYRALFIHGKAKKGDTVLVHGASGGVGLAACQLAVSRGIHVIGTAGTEQGMQLVEKNGAVAVFNHRSDSYVNEIRQKYPCGMNLILEMAAHINLNTDLTLLAQNGKVAVIGSRGEVVVNPRNLMGKESCIFGVALAQSTPDEFVAMAGEINNLLTNSSVRPVVAKEYPLAQLAEAHQHITAGHGAVGNIVITI